MATTLKPPNGASRLLATTRRFDSWWLLVALVVFIIFFLRFNNPTIYKPMLGFIQDGIKITLLITVTSFLTILVVGLIGGLGRVAKFWPIHGLATLYVEVVRGVPLLVQILFWYFAFPNVIQRMGEAFKIQALMDYMPNKLVMAIAGLSFCYGAYMSEIYRAGIQSIPKGQMEAARSLGMTYFQAMRFIILPQAIRVIMPPIGNEFISLLKDSSLVSAVAIEDITLRGRQYMVSSFLAIETFVVVGLLYLAMTLFATRIVNWIERKTKTEH